MGQQDQAQSERGMVTVELAIGTLSVAMAILVGVFVIAVVGSQARCSQAAAQIARAAARGDASAERRARETVPQGSTIEVTSSEGWVVVRVSRRASLGRLGPFTITGTATMPIEAGVSPPGGR